MDFSPEGERPQSVQKMLPEKAGILRGPMKTTDGNAGPLPRGQNCRVGIGSRR